MFFIISFFRFLFFPFRLRFFADGDPSGPSGGGGEQPTEMSTFKGADGKVAEIPKWVLEDINKGKKAQIDRATEPLSQKIDELTEQNKTISEQFKELQKSQMSEKEKREAEEQERQTEIAKIQEQRDHALTLFKNDRISNSIYKAISDFEKKSGKKVTNANHVEVLFKSTYQVDLDDKHNTIAMVENEQKSISEAIDEYLASPDNATLLQNTLMPGGGSSANHGFPPGVDPKNMSDEEYMQRKFDEYSK